MFLIANSERIKGAGRIVVEGDRDSMYLCLKNILQILGHFCFTGSFSIAAPAKESLVEKQGVLAHIQPQ
jgi:hypothetical protein